MFNAKNTLWDRAMKYMGYKPGYWFAYFVYCSIPVIAYVWFLLRRRNEPNEEETFVSRILKLTNENPWMWAVLVVVVGLPLAIVIYLACSKSSSSPTARVKKTDEFVPDDDEDQPESFRTKSNLNSPSEQEGAQTEAVDEQEGDDQEDEDDENEPEDDENETVIEGKEADEHLVDEPNDSPKETAEGGVKKRKPRRE